MSISQALSKAAKSAIKTLGGDIVLRRQSSGTYNPETGETRPSKISDSKIKGVMDKVNQVDLTLDGGLTAEDKKCMIAANSITFVPTKNDLVIVNGNEEYEILKVTKEEQANVAIVYNLFLTKAT